MFKNTRKCFLYTLDGIFNAEVLTDYNSRSTIYQIERKQTGGDIFGAYMSMLGFKATDITRIRTGLPNQIDLEDL